METENAQKIYLFGFEYNRSSPLAVLSFQKEVILSTLINFPSDHLVLLFLNSSSLTQAGTGEMLPAAAAIETEEGLELTQHIAAGGAPGGAMFANFG